MEERLPLQITVFDKAYTRKGQAFAPKSMNVLLLWNVPGYATFTLDRDHRRVNSLIARGARCVITYEPLGMERQVIMSGVVSETEGSGGPLDGVRTFTVLDDLNAVNDLVSYPVPGQPATNQGAAAYDVRTGPVETTFKNLVAANVAGQGIPKLTVQASAGAGSVQTIRHRMRNVGEHLLGAGIRHGIGWRVVQVGTTRELQAWVPDTYPRTLTEESGVATAVEFRITQPEVTRVTVGIGGKAELREFAGPPTAGFVDTAAEAAWGICRHEFVDARDIDKADANKATLMLERATERLTEGASKASLKCELMETERLQFLKTYGLGDVVTIKPAGAAAITDRVREVEIDWSEGNPEPVVTPRVGEQSDSQDDETNKLVRRLLRAVEILGTE